MASATKDQHNFDPQAAFAVSPELNDRFVNFQKQVASAYIDNYEKTGLTFADYQEETAKAAQAEWLVTAGTAQAELTRKLTRLNVELARQSLK
jgi:hypothetical protein